VKQFIKMEHSGANFIVGVMDWLGNAMKLGRKGRDADKM
jgi:hypothetical protein